MKTIGICKLCGRESKLRHSHIIPSFIFRWLKSTSATGYYRFIKNPNKRVQDGIKEYLFCNECEGVFNKYETDFANSLFYPYASKELNAAGIASGKTKHFEYSSWLLYFAISVQWRLLLSWEIKQNTLSDKYFDLLESYKGIWKEFLNNRRKDTGSCETHVILLQNFMGGKGELPDNINSRINTYLIRAVDSTIAVSEKSLGIYSKLGPIALYTSLYPKNVKGFTNTRIGMKGRLSTAQVLANTSLTDFIFIYRPNEVIPKMKMSEKQREVVTKTLAKNIDNASESNTIKVLETDWLFEELRKNKPI